MSIITLTTDFGLEDWFVGTMKGVILGLAPCARVIDLTHEIGVCDVRAGAFTLAASYKFFPPGTVHVAVVDPGVGSKRQAVAIKTATYFFVGPDNGVLSWALAKEKIIAIHLLQNQKFFLKPISRTFHGRDVFAPVAAHLATGVPLQEFGPRVKSLVRLPWPEMKKTNGGLQGEVIYIDRFGNAITNIETASVPLDQTKNALVLVGSKKRIPLGGFYVSVPPGKPVAVPGSSGFLEIAVNGGSAQNRLRLKIGTRVIVPCRGS